MSYSFANMTNSAINKRMDTLDRQASKSNEKLIKLGFGDVKFSELAELDNPEAEKYLRIFDEKRAIRQEAIRRYGPWFQHRLPTRQSKTIGRRKNPEMATKKKAKRKATPAQLRALKKAHAALRKKRALKTKAPKRARRNPAYGNYSKARSVARGNTRGVNPVRKLSAVYVIGREKFRGKSTEYFDGIFFGPRANAAQWTALTVVKRIANSVANETGRPVSIFDIRK